MAEDLTTRVTALEVTLGHTLAKVDALMRAAIAHAGDTEAHPCSNNQSLQILRRVSPPNGADSNNQGDDNA